MEENIAKVLSVLETIEEIDSVRSIDVKGHTVTVIFSVGETWFRLLAVV